MGIIVHFLAYKDIIVYQQQMRSITQQEQSSVLHTTQFPSQHKSDHTLHHPSAITIAHLSWITRNYITMAEQKHNMAPMAGYWQMLVFAYGKAKIKHLTIQNKGNY
eukprot:8015939-Ditylum_brightwellii.AAC.1